MRGFRAFITGAICGALVGSVVVILFTPESGAELQSHIREYVNSFRDEIYGAYEDRKTQLENELKGLSQS